MTKKAPPLDLQLLTVAEVAEIKRISERQVRRQIARGELPYHRIGTDIRIRSAAATWRSSSRSGAATNKHPMNWAILSEQCQRSSQLLGFFIDVNIAFTCHRRS
jgi:excisionase family DNA binding protein